LLHISGGGFLTGKTRSRLWENSVLFNGEEHDVTHMALQLKVLFETWQREMKRRLMM
jgi:hypothetical protein